jgi:RNA polymerase sigma factor (sigma-70 family)
MVWGVCCRLLTHHDAEDAFQATFLVLVRKAASILPREMVGNWLYGVARQAALTARTRLAKRRTREVQVTQMLESAVAAPDSWDDVRPLLDQALAFLPDRYRVVVVLCDLEGKTRKEAARQLGLPEGTVASRLARARAMLAKRLARRGLTVSAGILAAVLSERAASASVPGSAMANTIKALTAVAAGQATLAISVKVGALTEGIMKSMLLTKLKSLLAVAVAMLVTVGTGAGLLGYGTAACQQTQGQKADAVAPQQEVAESGDEAPANKDAAEMHVIGLYGPKGLTQNNKRVDVELRPTAKPVVLVLTSYYTADWYLRLAPRAQVKQIILGGANEQTIAGVPNGVPVVRCFPKDPSDRARFWFYAYDPKSSEYRETVRKLNEMTRLPVTTFQGEYEGTSLVVDGKRGRDYVQNELMPPAAAPRPMTAKEIREAAAGAELHVLAIAKPREPGEPVNVEVRKTAKPVVLTLTSGPHHTGTATWRVKIGEGAQLKLVIFGGSASEIEGLPAVVPVVDRRRFRSHFADFDWRRDKGLLFPPGNYRSSLYLISDHRPDTFFYRRMVEYLNSLTGLPLASFQGQEVGTSFVVDEVKGREFAETVIHSAHASLKPQELLMAARGCELHIVGIDWPKDDMPVNVEVRSTTKPAVLVLTARMSALWKLKLAEGARLKAVILGGQHEQDVEGVPAGIPVIHRTYYPDDGSRRQDGYFWGSRGGSVDYREMVRQLNETTGLPVASFQGARNDTSFVVDGTRGSQFAEKNVRPNLAHRNLTLKDLGKAAAGCELHYVGVSGAKGYLRSTSDAVAVEVKATEKPVVLVLASEIPVIWKLQVAEKARVRAVVLIGHGKPAIDGLAADVPVLRHSPATANPARSLCVHEWGSMAHRYMMQELNAMTGLPVATCQGEQWGSFFVIDGVQGRNFGQQEIKPRLHTPTSLKPQELLAAANGAELHVVGTYWSEVGDAGEHVAGSAGGVVEVEVQPTDKPVVLALTSWFSVAWKIKLADKARVKAIIVGGGYEQEIGELPAQVPVVMLPPGRHSYGGYQANSPEFRSLSKSLTEMTGLPVATFQGQEDGTSFVVDVVRGRDFGKKPDAPPVNRPQEDPLADVADIPSQELQAAGDANKRYFLIGPRKGGTPPAEGYRLLVILPGGDGSADFHPFVKRMHKNALSDRYLAAQPIAVRWTPGQEIVWPTKTNPVADMKFSTEEFVDAVIKDVTKKHKVDRTRVFTLSWSSSGPAAYATSLQAGRAVTGSFIAMSVFNPKFLPPLKQAKGHAYYLYHSPGDRVCPYRMAKEASKSLAENGAKVRLETYEGNHGWTGDVYNDIRQGIEWLEDNHETVNLP